MEPAYEAKKYEKEIYQRWEASGFFNPDGLTRILADQNADTRGSISVNQRRNQRQPVFTIALPPPNVTGSLHLGHALNGTIQDILVRYYRMNGCQALWLPGTDHAGIATQNVVEKQLKKEGTGRHQLGREKFVERAWQWVEQYGNLIIEQLKKIGCSCDWSRQRFTLDKNYVEAVETAFIHYYKKGLIYRGPRLVNWCPRCETAISDIEVKHQPVKGKLYYLRYPLKRDPKLRIHPNVPNNYFVDSDKLVDSDRYVIVATTRPETMLGDTAVAVNPKDKRYKNLVGQKIILPLMNRQIPIISHHLIDPKFGTGAVKVTPAHDAVDWKIGKEKNLEIINVIGPDGRMTAAAGKFAGLKVREAREKIIEELRHLNLLEKEEDYDLNLSLCDRCGTAVEPQISIQWFLKMKDLAKPAKEVVQKGKIKIIPERYKKIYLDWLSKVEDWCISRQLWWGHRLPVWFCKRDPKLRIHPNVPNNYFVDSDKLVDSDRYIVSIEKPSKCPFCGECEMKQSEDVLDTWFSSALWPFAILGFPNKTKDLKEFYPTNFLSTAQEILYLWVARMVFSSLEFTGKIPFENVYIHPTVLALTGKRMSKSLGTGVDPLEIADKYGADSVRMGLMYQMNREQQSFKFDERAVMASRNFINKIWNIARFIEMTTSQIRNPKSEIRNKFKIQNSKFKTATIFDKWILSRLNTTIASVSGKIEKYQFGEATRELYDFVWHEFADWYLEVGKIQMTNSKFQMNTIAILQNSLFIILKLLHPLAPFVTEEIYQQFFSQRQSALAPLDGFASNGVDPRSSAFLMVAEWPKADKKLINKKAESDLEKIKNLIIEIRNWRKEQNIQPKDIIDYKIKKSENVFSENKEIIENLARVKIIF